MTEHAALRVTSCTTGVDEATAVTGFLLAHLSENDFILDCFS